MPDGYTLIGKPTRARGKNVYLQTFRIAGESKRRNVSLRTDRMTTARARADRIVAEKVKEVLKAQGAAAYKGMELTAEELLSDYLCWMRSCGNSPKHINQTETRIEAVVNGLKLKSPVDITPVHFARWLRQKVDAADFRLRTAQKYQEQMRAYLRWLWRERYIESNPLERMEKLKGDVSNSRPRQPLSDAQIVKLLKWVRSCGVSRRNLTPEHRYWLYRLAAASGLRAHELSSLTPESFNLSNGSPHVVVACTISKRRTRDEVRLNREFAAELREWIESLPAGELIFPSRSWWYKAAGMLRADLEGAGLPIGVKSEDGFAHHDFHSWRSYRVTQCVLSGAPHAVVQAAVRLSSPTLIARYLKVPDSQVDSLVEAVGVPSSGQRKTQGSRRAG